MIEVEVPIAQLKQQGFGLTTKAFQKWLKVNGLRVVRQSVRYITFAAEDQNELVARPE